MSDFNPEKLFVTYTDGVTCTGPIIPRAYTLTHSDVTGELFLSIGCHYAWENINIMRDEVLGEWKQNKARNCLFYRVFLYIDQGEYDIHEAAKRNEIFRRELPLALTAIRYGDRALFNKYPFLDKSFIIIHFMSAYSQFAKKENWGTFDRYSLRF